jgi:ATP-dependent helicase/nuclease subunit A
VQLLTVHGAKGLEAEVVFVVDSDPEPKAAETASLLVDWPVEAAAPRHCAFVYAESQCPPSLACVWQRELAAREREELNGLYVAMTRARSRLVFSATEPFRPLARPSWWQRVLPHCEALGGEAGRDRAAAGPQPGIVLPALPRWEAAASQAPGPSARAALDDPASRLGQAVHRTLEWVAAYPLDATPALGTLAAAAAREFGVDAAEVTRLAACIWHSPDCARFFAGPGLHWAGNEVSVGDAGEVLRIDRLVELDEAGQRTWWVLDYKLQQAPEALPAYREQLRRYRRAVQALQPGQPVRCAFITGAGKLIEIA